MSDFNSETKPLNSIESVHLKSYYGTDDDRNHLIHENDRPSTTSTTSLPQFLGHKATIGIMGSISIAVNSITGPAMVDLPATFQRSGWIPTTVTLLFVCILSSLCSLHLADTISKYPGNLNFEREVEFSESFRYFWGHRWFVVTEILFFACITCLNMSSIVDTAQVVDTFFGHFFGFSSALHITSTHQNLEVVHWYPAECSAETLMAGECLAFADHADGILLTLGYVITTSIFLPMALMDLKENSVFQIMGFLVLIATVIQFAIEFGLSGLDFNNMSLWGSSWDALLGVVLFNFALVIAIPAWLYEKHSNVSVPVVVHGASILSTLLYIIVGAMGALAIPNVSDNMLESMMSGSFGITMQAGSILFAFMIIGLGIPLFSVLTRMNLTGSGLTSHLVGNLLAVYFPFSVSWILYQGDLVTELLSWGGVIFTSAVAFILPLILALHTVLEFDLVGSIEVYGPCWKQQFQSRRAKIVALVIILSLTVMAVVSAIVGQFWIMDDDENPSALPRVG
jgi:amino acid permease